jgi:hypothetical protein
LVEKSKETTHTLTSTTEAAPQIVNQNYPPTPTKTAMVKETIPGHKVLGQEPQMEGGPQIDPTKLASDCMNELVNRMGKDPTIGKAMNKPDVKPLFVKLLNLVFTSIKVVVVYANHNSTPEKKHAAMEKIMQNPSQVHMLAKHLREKRIKQRVDKSKSKNKKSKKKQKS